LHAKGQKTLLNPKYEMPETGEKSLDSDQGQPGSRQSCRAAHCGARLIKAFESGPIAAQLT
jgi:hypothetical protein